MRVRPLTFSDATIQTCLSTKVLIEMVLRQTTGFVDSLLRLAQRMQAYVFGLKIQAQ